MATKIKIKRGLEVNLPELDEGELALTTDTKQLYIGTNTGNKEIGGKDVRVGVTIDLLTNISGRTLTNYYLDKRYMNEQYPFINIQYQSDIITDVNLVQARNYLKHILGSSYIPTYEYDFPNNHYIIDSEGNIWKPQWTDKGSGGYALRLYMVNRVILSLLPPKEGDVLVYRSGKWLLESSINEWQELTLKNGFTGYIKFRKNILGQVELLIDITIPEPPIVNNWTTLPIGYRPSFAIMADVRQSVGGNGSVWIGEGGLIYGGIPSSNKPGSHLTGCLVFLIDE